ncbi:MAG: undecaprenyl-diphosphate phosphatase [Candidatus Bathyarchaeota archaeon]|nr:undecaprenyl-diphosphate phosphatase [Candidatus Bathyarchaeota archaeon]
MVTLIEALILAIIQGLTEWLPVSSSGHLVIAQEFLGLNPPLIFDVMLHVGTLIVVVAVFRKDILNILKAIAKGNWQSQEGKLALYIVAGSIPIAVTGFVLRDFFESMFCNLQSVGVALLVTGCVLFVSEKRVGTKKIGATDSLIIGLAQAVAIIPGVSRSGLTVSAGLLRKIDKASAFRFSFLLSVPAVLGATLFEVKDLVVGNVDMIPLLFGVIVAMVVGYLSLRLLQKIVLSEKFHYFSVYCWIAGLLLIVFVLIQ